MTLRRRIERVERLEHAASGSGYYVIRQNSGESREDAIRRAGIHPGPNDLVVSIVKYTDADFADDLDYSCPTELPQA